MPVAKEVGLIEATALVRERTCVRKFDHLISARHAEAADSGHSTVYACYTLVVLLAQDDALSGFRPSAEREGRCR